MTDTLSIIEKECLSFVELKQIKTDPSHDINHVKRVLNNAKKIHFEETIGDLKILIPASLFHDIVMTPKNNPKSQYDSEKSGIVASRFLKKKLNNYFSQEEINHVQDIITTCSFSKNLPKNSIEGWILQDADMLEAVGSISIMRTFASTGLMNKSFYNLNDPFCKERNPEPHQFGLDLFYARLFEVKNRLHTNTAKNLCKDRELILHRFIESLSLEITGVK